jgi:hypothetical protein
VLASLAFRLFIMARINLQSKSGGDFGNTCAQCLFLELYRKQQATLLRIVVKRAIVSATGRRSIRLKCRSPPKTGLTSSPARHTLNTHQVIEGALWLARISVLPLSRLAHTASYKAKELPRTETDSQ